MGTLSGMQLCHLHISFPSQEGFTLNVKNLLYLKHIPSVKSKLHYGRAMPARESKRKSRKEFPIEKWRENMEVYPLDHNVVLIIFCFSVFELNCTNGSDIMMPQKLSR